MNRHERRAAAARRQRNQEGHNTFYQRYVQHLPQVPLDAPLERGRVYHEAHHHDDWCRIYDTGNPADCNCNPAVTRHVEPRRS